MLRLTELRLPLDHPPETLRAAILQRLKLRMTTSQALVLAQMGFKLIVLELGKVVRERTQDTLGAMVQACGLGLGRTTLAGEK